MFGGCVSRRGVLVAVGFLHGLPHVGRHPDCRIQTCRCIQVGYVEARIVEHVFVVLPSHHALELDLEILEHSVVVLVVRIFEAELIAKRQADASTVARHVGTTRFVSYC